jgi:hypothetical protein
VWCVVCGVWCVVCRVSCVVCGVWCVVCGVWCVVCGVWCVVCRVACIVCCVLCSALGGAFSLSSTEPGQQESTRWAALCVDWPKGPHARTRAS